MRDSTINAEVFSECLRRLPDGLTLILDNASVHHANKCLWAKGLQSVAEVAEGKAGEVNGCVETEGEVEGVVVGAAALDCEGP